MLALKVNHVNERSWVRYPRILCLVSFSVQYDPQEFSGDLFGSAVRSKMWQLDIFYLPVQKTNAAQYSILDVKHDLQLDINNNPVQMCCLDMIFSL